MTVIDGLYNIDNNQIIDIPNRGYAIELLRTGQLKWKDYITALTPEQLLELRQTERNRVKQWYELNKERKNAYSLERSKQKVVCPKCEATVCKGYFSIHRKTNKCQGI